MSVRQEALDLLRASLQNPGANFRDGQLESILALLERKRILAVQRTGWGKSMVYFLATKLLREQGMGPTLLISPLLSLMRNQLSAAERIGIRARTVNSTNSEDWDQIYRELGLNRVDLLLISPERLANDAFRQDVLANLAGNIGLLAIDEAHCISDWGHDFRPDYRRIARVLNAMPSNVPVLATTATANNRVVNDIKSQLGHEIQFQRGTLVRKSLKLQTINMPSPAERMAWLVQILPKLPGSGIIYTLTQRDAEGLSKWLQYKGIRAEAYHASVDSARDEAGLKEELEDRLLENDVKVLVATVALGMGFDKPDLGFVIHYQRPSSVVHYYQQVGRAGRGVDEAFGILLCGEEDDPIAEYFIRNAFPAQSHVINILRAIGSSDNGLSIKELQAKLNVRYAQIANALKYLTLETPSPVVKIGYKWNVTATASSYRIDQDNVNAITAIRHAEQRQMQEYLSHSDCYMTFLQRSLDDPDPVPCGKCWNCDPSLFPNVQTETSLINEAGLFLKRNHQVLQPRKQWPAKDMFDLSPLGAFRIPESLQASEGRALCLWRDAGWGNMVADGKYVHNRFSSELVHACKEMLRSWSPSPAPRWVTCIPSLIHPDLVPDFARELADALGLRFVDCIAKAKNNRPQKEMENSFHQVKNLDGAFKITKSLPSGPCLLVDDVVDSGWTFTVASALLRNSGCSTVHPVALALNSNQMN